MARRPPAGSSIPAGKKTPAAGGRREAVFIRWRTWRNRKTQLERGKSGGGGGEEWWGGFSWSAVLLEPRGRRSRMGLKLPDWRDLV